MSKQKSLLTSIGLLLISLLIGFSVSAGTIFGLIYLSTLTIGLFILTIIVVLIDLLRKTRFSKYPILGLICLIASIIIALITNDIKESNRQFAAQKIIVQINSFKSKEGIYPESLDKIENTNLRNNFRYWVDSTGQCYFLDYSIDGWHRNMYDSRSKTWKSHD